MKRQDIVLQHDLKDCGACSLLSIIKHYGGYIPLEQIRIDTHTSLEGTTAYHIIEAARSYGFDSHGIKLDELKDIKNVNLPLIAHVKDNNLYHFVVIYNINKSKITIMDPAKGKRVMSFDEFAKIWTNNLILFYPKNSLIHYQKINIQKELFCSLFKNNKALISKIIIYTILMTILTIITSFYFKICSNLFNDNFSKRSISLIIVLFLFLFIAKILINYLKEYFKTILNKNIDGHVYYNFINRLFLLPNYFIKNRTTGEIITRIKEMENFKNVFSIIITTIFIDSILALSVGVILYLINHTLFLILLLVTILYLVFGLIFGKILYRKALDTNEQEIKFNECIIENLDLFYTIKNLNVTKKIQKKLEVLLIKYLNKLFSLNEHVLFINMEDYLFQELLNFILLSVGFIKIINHEITIIDLVVFESLINYFLSPFKNFLQIIPNYNYVKVNLEKINSFFSIEIENKKNGLTHFKTGDISIKKLNYSYNNFTNILNNISLNIKENSFVMFKGKSGSGKSTLCQILCRLIDDKRNDIKIGDINIYDYSLECIRKNITYVSQKESLIQDTIKNNIIFNRNYNEKKFNDVVKICEIESIVNKKPFGYESFLMKDAVNISGGEKQRIILARALLNNFNILILDESLSEVNMEMETRIINNLKRYYKNKTIIYVSHKNHDSFFDQVYNFGGLNER